MIAVETSVHIDAAVERVFAFMSDFDNDVHWWREVRESRRIAGEGPGVGATYWQRSRLLGSTSETTFKVVAFEPNRSVSIQTLSGPLPYTADFRFEAVPGATRVTFAARIQAAGLYRLAEPLVGRVLVAMTRTNFGHLKRLLETTPAETTPAQAERAQAEPAQAVPAHATPVDAQPPAVPAAGSPDGRP